MKEKDLEKNLHNLIIDGLIKEAEQDNADFQAAMRAMSEADFRALLPTPELEERHIEPMFSFAACDSVSGFMPAMSDMLDDDDASVEMIEEVTPVPSESKRGQIRTRIAVIADIIAILVALLLLAMIFFR